MTPGKSPNQARAERVERALANPLYCGEVYMRPYDEHWREGGPLPIFAAHMLAFCLTVRRGVIILPPEFLKTTLISQLLPLWITLRATARGELTTGMLLSEEEDMAIKNLSVLKWHIEHNERLASDFSDREGRPLLRPDPDVTNWKEDSITVARPWVSKDPTWQAKGVGSSGVQGTRLRWLIGDDIVTPVNAFSPAKRDKALRDWDMQFTTRLRSDGTALVAGNYNHPQDLVNTLTRRQSYKTFVRPAYHVPGNPTKAMDPSDPRAVPLWPNNWTRERGIQEKQDKPTTFGRILLLRSSDEMGKKLRVDWVTLIDEDDTPEPYSKFFMGIDPAPGGETDDLDFFNISVGAMHGTHLDLIESFNLRGSLNQQIATLGSLHDRYQRIGQGVIAIGVSKVAIDRYFRNAVDIVRPDLAIKLHEVTIIEAEAAKEVRLEALGPFARTKWLRIRRSIWDARTSDEVDQNEELTLHEEWKEFPNGRHDDRLDGLDVLIRCGRELELVGGESTWNVEAVDAA